MDAKEAFAEGDSIHVLDVREPFEWELGHVAGSIHIPMQELQHRASELPTDKPLLCVCTVGARSEYVAGVLRAAGFEAENLEGGLVTWQGEGFPLVKDDGGEADVWKGPH
jgi:rhodanese-related sulfurtransferase